MSEFATYPSLKDKVVFITGGTSGIGEDFVRQFAMQGAKVAFVGRSEDKGRALVENIQQTCQKSVLYIPCDVGETQQLQSAIDQAAKALGDIAVLINNAANDQRHSTQEVTDELWHNLFAVNLKHQFFAAQAVLPMMSKNKSGSIINLSSNCYMMTDIPSYPCYMIAKSGIVGLTNALAREFGEHKIRVNCVMPGWVMTKKQIDLWLTPEAEAETLKQQCLKERLYPEDMSRLALFLAADDSRMITKQCIVADAGRV